MKTACRICSTRNPCHLLIKLSPTLRMTCMRRLRRSDKGSDKATQVLAGRKIKRAGMELSEY